MNDIVIIGNDSEDIIQWKIFLHDRLHTKDLGKLKYLYIEVVRSKQGICLSQRKYVLDMLVEAGKDQNFVSLYCFDHLRNKNVSTYFENVSTLFENIIKK